MSLYLLCLSLVISVCSTEDEPPICKLCYCHKTNSLDIKCSTKLEETYIFNASMWKTSNDIEIHSVTIEDNIFRNCSRELPSIDLVYLNLANNDLTCISVNMFRNLMTMETLILSNNEIQTFEADKVNFFQ